MRERESPTITGIGVSPGRVLGPVVLMPQPIAQPPVGRHLAIGQDRDVAADRITTASAQVRRDLTDAAARARGKSRELLETTALMATDPELIAALHGGGCTTAVSRPSEPSGTQRARCATTSRPSVAWSRSGPATSVTSATGSSPR